jgi:hypothetical protein
MTFDISAVSRKKFRFISLQLLQYRRNESTVASRDDKFYYTVRNGAELKRFMGLEQTRDVNLVIHFLCYMYRKEHLKYF